MTTSEQLRNLHIAILAAVHQAECLENNPDFEQGSEARDLAFELQCTIESTIFQKLFRIKDALGVNWEPIEQIEVM